MVYVLRGADEDDEGLRSRVDLELQDFLGDLGRDVRAQPPSAELAVEITRQIFEFLDVGALKAAFPAYTRNDLLDVMIEAFSLHLQEVAAESETWAACIDRYVGANDVPMMPVHKSKGLEYDTVFLWDSTINPGGVTRQATLTASRHFSWPCLGPSSAPSSCSASAAAGGRRSRSSTSC